MCSHLANNWEWKLSTCRSTWHTLGNKTGTRKFVHSNPCSSLIDSPINKIVSITGLFFFFFLIFHEPMILLKGKRCRTIASDQPEPTLVSACLFDLLKEEEGIRFLRPLMLFILCDGELCIEAGIACDAHTSHAMPFN